MYVISGEMFHHLGGYGRVNNPDAMRLAQAISQLGFTRHF